MKKIINGREVVFRVQLQPRWHFPKIINVSCTGYGFGTCFTWSDALAFAYELVANADQMDVYRAKEKALIKHNRKHKTGKLDWLDQV